MSANPIPDELRSDHLFLLVGTNPLPDWVAAKLLLRKGGRLYLVHSKTTLRVAERLARFLGSQNCDYVFARDEHNAITVTQAIESQLKSISSNSVGLNYTGGTKVMAVHAYRALEKRGGGKVVFSYLEAPEFLMQFDANADWPTGHQQNVGLIEDVRLKLDDLFRLHEAEQGRLSIDRFYRAESAFQSLIDLHLNEAGRRAWRWWCLENLRYSKTHLPPRGSKLGDFRAENDLQNQVFTPTSRDATVTALLDAVVESLFPDGASNRPALGDVVKGQQQHFHSATQLAKWLDGEWLEDYTLRQVSNQMQSSEIEDCGRNIVSSKPAKFQADVAAIRGYQLHLISCYSGHEDQTCKHKLFEVFMRARQLGGEAARAALVCCADDPGYIERQAGDLWDLREQIRVFGRNDLPDLSKKLEAWFLTGAK